MGKRKTYDDEFRASAVVMLEAQGYPNTTGALSMVANHLGIQPRTLSRWFNKEQNPPPDYLVKEKKGEFVERSNDLIDLLFDEMSTAAVEAPLNHLAMTFGIVFDKRQIAIGGPTQRSEHTGANGGPIEQNVRVTGLEHLSDDDLRKLIE